MNIESLSDAELIGLIRARNDRAAVDELARRCLVKLRKVVQRLIHLCPPAEDRSAFVEDVVSLASQKVFKSLHTFREDFDHWLVVVAKSVALDQHKHYSGKQFAGRVSLETFGAEAAEPSASVDFRSRCWVNDTQALAQKRELARIVMTVLSRHSQKREESAIAVRLAQEYRIPEVAIKQGYSQTTIRKLLEHDYEALRRLLRDMYGIRRLDDLLEN